MAHDVLQVVEKRLPFEQRTGTVGSRQDLRRVPDQPAGELHLKIDAGHPLYRLDHVGHGETAVTAISVADSPPPRRYASASECARRDRTCEYSLGCRVPSGVG
jgi:hypothetical protein